MPTTPHDPSTRPHVLTLGTGLTVLGAMRALGRRGVRTLAIPGEERLIQDSRFFRPAPPRPESETSLSAYLDRAGLRPVVLLPCSDNASLEVAELMETAPERVFASVARPGVQRRLLDKSDFADLLAETGTPHPRTLRVGPQTSYRDVDAELLSRAFVKPTDSQSFFRRFQVKAFRPGGAEDLDRVLTAVREDGFEVVIQEYVPGPASNHYFVDGFMDREGAVRGRLARRRLRMHPADFGNSTYMRSVAGSEVAPAIEALDALLAAIGYRGPFSAEFKKDERDGVFRLLEINARAWWYIEFAARCGIDVAWMAYLDALGEPVPSQTDYQIGRSLVYPTYDVSACARELHSGALTRAGWLRSWVGSDRPLFTWDDPMPALRETWRRGVPAVRRRMPWNPSRAPS